jgi:Na+/H+-translocating membrane pyrophosphatase
MNRIGKMSQGAELKRLKSQRHQEAHTLPERQYKTIAKITVVLFVLLWNSLPSGPYG